MSTAEHGCACCCHEHEHSHEHEHEQIHEHEHIHEHHHEHHEHEHCCGDACGCGHEHHHHGAAGLKTAVIRLIAAALLFAASYLVPEGLPRRLFLLLPYLTAGYDVLWGALRGIVRGRVFDENFLMSVATVGAVALGDMGEAVAVMVFYQLGALFEEYAVGRSRGSIAALMDLRPDKAELERDGEVVSVEPEEVAPGSVIVVRPGERVPIDGVVIEGESALDTSALTGESLPRPCAPGDEISSGCVSLTGLLRVRTTRPFGESAVSRILELAEQSSARKSRSERFITRFARVYTPAVCAAALLLALLPPAIRLALGLEPGWAGWVENALTFLVISCPCALVISVPLGFFGGIGGASTRGVLFKGSTGIEAMAAVRCVAFDKTGTLTRGEFEVTGSRPEPDVAPERLLELAALAESWSNHPISRSLKEAAGSPDASSRVTDAREEQGGGVSALVDGLSVSAGSRRYMSKLGIDCSDPEGAGTVVHVAADGRYLGCILLADAPKPRAAEAIAAVRALGARPVMLTGDSERAAALTAGELGLTDYRAGLLPGGKVEALEELMSEAGGSVAFVGDGVNDAPVLARADVGVAMGALGSDAAIEAADVVIMDDDPAKLPLAIRLSRRCLGIVRQNIAFALIVKLAFLALGALGLVGMTLAVFADVGVMVLAVLNSLRTLKVRAL